MNQPENKSIINHDMVVQVYMTCLYGFWQPSAPKNNEQPTLRGRRMKKSSASEIVGVLAIQVMDAFW